MGELGYAQIRFFQITLGFADAVNVGIFADGIPGDLFKYPADIGFTEIKFRTEFIQRNGPFAVFREIICDAVDSQIFGIVRLEGKLLMLLLDEFYDLKKPGSMPVR